MTHSTAVVDPFGDVPLAPIHEPRLPVILVVHGSPSLRRDARDSMLEDGVRAFLADITRDPMSRRRVEIATFGDVMLQSLAAVEPVAPAVARAIASARSRLAFLSTRDVPCHRPKILFLCDAASAFGHGPAISDVAAGEAAGEFDFLAIDIGGVSPCTSSLRELSIREPIRLKGLEFPAMFAWLADRVVAAARSPLGNETAFEMPPSRWAA